jgi:hypothetical protein
MGGSVGRRVRLKPGIDMADALNSATFYASIFGDHAGSVASQVIALAMAHPVLTFQVFALLSILMHRRGSQI